MHKYVAVDSGSSLSISTHLGVVVFVELTSLVFLSLSLSLSLFLSLSLSLDSLLISSMTLAQKAMTMPFYGVLRQRCNQRQLLTWDPGHQTRAAAAPVAGARAAAP